MCDDVQLPRFVAFHHHQTLNDYNNIPLDLWMQNNIPDEYRVCGITMREIVDTTQAIVTFSYTIMGELKD